MFVKSGFPLLNPSRRGREGVRISIFDVF